MMLTYWDWQTVVSSHRLTPASGVPGRLYSDRTFVSIRKPLIQDQSYAAGLWIVRGRDPHRQMENSGGGQKDYRSASAPDAPLRAPGRAPQLPAHIARLRHLAP